VCVRACLSSCPRVLARARYIACGFASDLEGCDPAAVGVAASETAKNGLRAAAPVLAGSIRAATLFLAQAVSYSSA